MPPVTREDLIVEFPGTVTPESARTALEVFARHGCFVAVGLISDRDLEPIRAAFRTVLGLRRRHLGLPVSGPVSEFDADLLDLLGRDPDERRLIQMTCMFALPLLRFGADGRLARLSEVLMATDAVIASDLQSLHISLPNENAHLLPWHQDYPWVQDSEDALIYWLPLRDLPERNAALEVALGSHRLGVQTLRERDGRLMGLADPAVADRFPQLVVPVRAGEVLVVHTLLLHRSVRNRSDRSRWSIQIRQGNFSHAKAVARRWPGPRPDRTPFSETHPEYCDTDPARPWAGQPPAGCNEPAGMAAMAQASSSGLVP